jgi:hypothetical protein
MLWSPMLAFLDNLGTPEIMLCGFVALVVFSDQLWDAARALWRRLER